VRRSTALSNSRAQLQLNEGSDYPRARTSIARATVRSGRYVALLGIVVAFEVAYILHFSPFVTADAAFHLATASALDHSLTGGFVGSRFLEWNPWPAPNLSVTALTAAFIRLFGSDTAEKLVSVAYVISLPLAGLYALSTRRESGALLAFFILPLTFSLTFLHGWLACAYSSIVFLVVAGFVLRSATPMSASRTAGLAALLLLAYLTHIVGYLEACLFVWVLLGTRAVVSREHRRQVLVRGALAFAPSVALALVFVISSNSQSGWYWGAGPIPRVAGLISLTWGVATYDRSEFIFCVLAAAALWALIALASLRRRPWRERDADTFGLALFTLAAALVAIVSPYGVGSGGGQLPERLMLFPVFGVIMWLGRQQLRKVELEVAAAIAVVAAFGLAAVRYDQFQQLDRIASDLVALERCVPPGQTMIQANLASVPFGSLNNKRIDPLVLEVGRVAAARGGLDLGDIEWHLAYSIQRYQPAADPFTYLPARVATHYSEQDAGKVLEEVPPPLDFGRYERATGRRVDDVFLWGRPEMTAETRDSRTWRGFDRSLRAQYHRYARSPLGWWELWSKRPGTCVRT